MNDRIKTHLSSAALSANRNKLVQINFNCLNMPLQYTYRYPATANKDTKISTMVKITSVFFLLWSPIINI